MELPDMSGLPEISGPQQPAQSGSEK